LLYRRGKVWWIKIKWKGKLIRRSSGSGSKERARRIEAKILNELEEGKWFEKDPAEMVLFREAWEKYLREDARYKSESTYNRAVQVAKNLLPVLGDLTLKEITPSVLSAYRAKRLEEGVKMSTASKELQFVRRVFSLCKRDWQLTRESPFEYFRMPADKALRVRFLEPGQFEKLLMACPAWLRPMVTLARYTGLRRGNILGVTWGQVELDRGLINLDRTKNGHRLAVPLSETPLKMLLTLKKARVVRLDCPYVFNEGGKPYNPYQVSMAFKRACKRAGVPDFRFHDLRHDFASNLVQRGNDIYLVQHLLGHRDGRMTQRYAHLRVEDLRRAVDTLEGGTKWGTVENEKGATHGATP
jgi:integrase